MSTWTNPWLIVGVIEAVALYWASRKIVKLMIQLNQAEQSNLRLRAWINYQARPIAGGPFRGATPPLEPLPERYDDMGQCRRCGAHALQPCDCTDEQWYRDLKEKRP